MGKKFILGLCDVDRYFEVMEYRKLVKYVCNVLGNVLIVFVSEKYVLVVCWFFNNVNEKI